MSDATQPQPETVALSDEHPAPNAPEVEPTKEAVEEPAKEAAPATIVDEAPEPQNSLTEKFAEAEWTALKEFRGEVPTIFTEAFPDKAEAKTSPVTLWGVVIDPTNLKTDARVSVILMKFLRARNLSVAEAKHMLISTLRWRESFNIESVLKEEFPDDVFGKVGYIYGRDKEHRPVVYNLYGANPDLQAVFGDVPRFIRWRVALQEKSIQELDFVNVDQMVQVHDYEGVSLWSGAGKAAAREASAIFQDHYPEFLSKKYFVNVPILMVWIFYAFRPFISPATLAKFELVGRGQYALHEALSKNIDATELPKRYGGEAEGF
ncbi:CRAL/TRIO domain-containing protein [Fistulina hepatica ATCC 64428]|uniref:Phosphatidylinositol transfer protein SFH5 n=1 Tax=Fistulina hepatica ATCC 64428 TaxID=1128425 RepID=A0A0D7A8E6_9AGAR|nr:CRAL/TRIO domain-containing protein [Fistulina hepatica ATCC 64428]